MSFEAALLAAFLAGFLGSGHCVGMCGAIVVLFEGGGHDSPGARLRRLSYNAGRGAFYVVLGVLAGLSGALLSKAVGVANALTLLRYLAAFLVIAIGLNLLFGWRITRFLESAGSGVWRNMSRHAGKVLPATTVPRSLAAGFIWGALPCGLVYSAVAIAATAGHPIGGGAVMLTFWLGTLPMLLLVGESARRLDRLRSNRAFRRTAGIVVILVGLAALVPFGHNSEDHSHHAASVTTQQLE